MTEDLHFLLKNILGAGGALQAPVEVNPDRARGRERPLGSHSAARIDGLLGCWVQLL